VQLAEALFERFDLVREQHQLRTAIEVDGDQLTPDVLACRANGTLRGAVQDAALVGDGPRRPATQTWDKGRIIHVGSPPSDPRAKQFLCRCTGRACLPPLRHRAQACSWRLSAWSGDRTYVLGE
jgi:hypothetical protein